MEVDKSCFEQKEMILAKVVIGGETVISKFYLVDLRAGELLSDCIDPVINEWGNCDVACVEGVIYNIGAADETSLDKLNPKLMHGDYHIHKGASCLELSTHSVQREKGKGKREDEDGVQLGSHICKWKDIPPMNYHRNFPCCASLGGKVYALGRSMQETCIIGEAFDPKIGHWIPLAPPPSNLHLEKFLVSPPVIPDEQNDRLLVHFDTANSLYAFYPDIGKWDCLANNFTGWLPPTSLVDDVLYFYCTARIPCLLAYDLLTKSWLDLVYSSTFPSTNVEMDAMLHLGNGLLCLATFWPVANHNQTKLHFIKFRVHRSSPGEVTVTPVSTNSFTCEGHFEAYNFILL